MQKYLLINHFFLLILLSLYLCTNSIAAQDPSTDIIKKNIKALGDKIINTSQEDKLLLHTDFKTHLTDLLNKKNSYKLDLSDILPLYVTTSPDNKFRIISWSIKISDNKWLYTSILQFNTKHSKWIELDNFLKNSNNHSDLSCIYYNVIVSSKKDKQYILLGWRKKNNSINTKIIEPLTLDNNYHQLGSAIFSNYGANTYRLVFDYPNNSTLLVDYQKGKRRILIEHLSEQDNGNYMPDGSYDALKFNGAKWQLINNVAP
ncbi:MAG: hypothetical protein ACQPRJ_03390 [Solitalea-like symbiont of Acarus siro]